MRNIRKLSIRLISLLTLLFIIGCQTMGTNSSEEKRVPVQTDYEEDQKDVEPLLDEDKEIRTSEDVINQQIEPDEIPSMAETFSEYFPIGAAIELHQTYGETAELLKKHVNMLVAENAMKPDALQPTEGNFNWDHADQIIEFAQEHNMEIRFHTLVWHSQVGDWFFLDEDGRPMVDEDDPDKREENKNLLLERLDTHVRTIVDRYKDDIASWDVVNEVIEPDDKDGMRASEWYQITGTEYIETAFHAAREAGGTEIKLYLNDYGTDNPKKRNLIYELVKELLDKGIPIDGIGHQTHIDVHEPTIASILESIKMFSELGLDNIITELDMSIYAWDDHQDYGTDIPEEILTKQAKRYKELFSEFREHKDKISKVVFWGIADDHTWLHSFPVNRTNAPLLFDQNHQPKPAFWAVVDPLKFKKELKKITSYVCDLYEM